MAEDGVEDTLPASSQPFFVPSGFPFVFLPTTITTGFSGANNRARVSATDDQKKTESRKNVNDENTEEKEVEDEEEEAEIVGTDGTNRNNKNDDYSDEKDDLRISQPKYSQLLKELDFSHARMVDVTNLITDELDQQMNDSMANENQHENPIEQSSNPKYVSSSSEQSSVSSDELLNNRKSNINNNAEKDERRRKEEKELKDAADEIQNDLNNLAAYIQVASQLSSDKVEEEEEENNNHLQKRHTFDEDDDTSKQATQNYDLLDNEQEEILPSSKSSKIPRVINQQQSNVAQNENKSFNSNTNINRNSLNTNQNQTNDQQASNLFADWTSLFHGTESHVQESNELKVSQAVIDGHITPKQVQEHREPVLSDEESEPRMKQLPQQKIHYRSRQAASSSTALSSSSSSSDTGSVVQYDLNRSKQNQESPRLQRTTPPVYPSQTVRQDSQATLIDENLDDLSIQMKQVLDQERQTFNTSTKEERTTDGIGSISMRLSTADLLSTNLVDNDNLNKYPSHEQVIRRSSDAQEHSSSQRRKTQHHHHPRYATSYHFERHEANGSRQPDENWLTVLDRLEREHKTRLEKQQQQYENQMHTLEEKMKRRFDDYLTLTNGFQESRLDNHDSSIHVYPTPSSVPIDSNIGKYKDHSYTYQHRSLADDIISQYYPADSTLNILTSDKKRSINNCHGQCSKSKDDTANLRTELSAIHAKHIADLKLYYEYEINELKSQLNRLRMGQTSSSTRQSMETIGRINSENIRLHDEINEIRHSLETTEEENTLLKRQLEELREQLSSRDLDLKNYHRTIVDLEKQLTETENTKERQDEKIRHADRQALLYREENEKIKTDLTFTRERLLRLEERFNEQEIENEALRRQLFAIEKESNRIKNSSTMALNQTTSAEYGNFVTTKVRLASPKTNTLRDSNIDSRRYKSNDVENSIFHAHSPRPITRISDYLNEKPIFPPAYVPPTRHTYSPRKPSPNRRRTDASTRTSVDRQARQTEQLEQKFDQLLRKKRELEARLNRIPLRGLTNIDRQLYDVLEREIERVEQQISSVKLELRKLSVLRTH